MLTSVPKPAEITKDSETCPACVRHSGLCQKHERSILPQLAQPYWYRLVGEQHFTDKDRKPSKEALKIIRRKDRLRAKRLRELVDLIATPAKAA